MATVTTRRRAAARAKVPAPVAAPAVTEELSEGQKPSSDALAPREEPQEGLQEPEPAYQITRIEPELPEPALDRVLVPLRRPGLVPEWVPKLQWIASGAAIFFAAVAIVVERHEQRFHGTPAPDEDGL